MAVLLAAAGLVAVADWIVVWRRPNRAEVVLKPLVLVLLIAAALVLDPEDGAQRAWFVAALVLSLAGDVFLLPQVDRFVPGLASFLLAHVAYVVGFWQHDEGGAPLLLVPAAVALAAVAVVVVRLVRRSEPALLGPVVAYIVVIGSMLASALLRGDGTAMAGAALFCTSDSILALGRFGGERRWGPVAVMATYHLAQGVLVASL